MANLPAPNGMQQFRQNVCGLVAQVERGPLVQVCAGRVGLNYAGVSVGGLKWQVGGRVHVDRGANTQKHIAIIHRSHLESLRRGEPAALCRASLLAIFGLIPYRLPQGVHCLCSSGEVTVACDMQCRTSGRHLPMNQRLDKILKRRNLSLRGEQWIDSPTT